MAKRNLTFFSSSFFFFQGEGEVELKKGRQGNELAFRL